MNSFERRSGQISALDSEAPPYLEECREATSKTASSDNTQGTCADCTAIPNSTENEERANSFSSDSTETRVTSCNTALVEEAIPEIEKFPKSNGSVEGPIKAALDTPDDQPKDLPTSGPTGFSVGSNASFNIAEEPPRPANPSLNRVTSDHIISDSSSFRPSPLSVVIPPKRFPENFGSTYIHLGRPKQDEASEISSVPAPSLQISMPKIVPPDQLQGVPRINSNRDRRYKMHVSFSRRMNTTQDPSCLQEQSDKSSPAVSESISTQLSIPSCPAVQPAPIIIPPKQLSNPPNITSVPLSLKKLSYNQPPLITQIASLPFPVANSTNSTSSRPKGTQLFPVFTGKIPDIMPIPPLSAQSGAAFSNKKEDSDHSQSDYNSMESNEESYYYYSESSPEDTENVHSEHASSTTIIDLDMKYENNLTEESGTCKDNHIVKHIQMDDARRDRQSTSITPVHIPSVFPLNRDSIASPPTYGEKAPYSTDFQRLRPIPLLPQTPSSDSNISLAFPQLGYDHKDFYSLSKSSLSQNSTTTTGFRASVKTPIGACNTEDSSAQRGVRHAVSNSSILRNFNFHSTLRQNKSVDFDGKHLSKLGHTVITADYLENRQPRLSHVDNQSSTSSTSEETETVVSSELFSKSRYSSKQSSGSAGSKLCDEQNKSQPTIPAKDRVSFSGRDTIVEFPHTEGEGHSIIICQNDNSSNLACTQMNDDPILDKLTNSLCKQNHLSVSAKDVVSCSSQDEATTLVKTPLAVSKSQGGNMLPSNTTKLPSNLSQSKFDLPAKNQSVGRESLSARNNIDLRGREKKHFGDLYGSNAFKPRSRAQSKTPHFAAKHEPMTSSLEMADFLGLEFVASEDTQYTNKSLRSNRSFVRALEMVPQSNRYSQSTIDCHSSEITITAPSEVK